jgi:hypothetical protein
MLSRTIKICLQGYSYNQTNMAHIMFILFLFYTFGLIFIINPISSKKNVADSDPVLIKNSHVTCYNDRIVIHWYYFPFGDKTIKYRNIRSCELLTKDLLNFFETKTWGMAFSSVWWHLDIHRHSRKYFIILDTGKWPKIGLTMKDNDTLIVYKLIKQKMDLTSLKKHHHHRNSTG